MWLPGDSALPVEVKHYDALDAVERDAAGLLDRAARASLYERLSWFRLVADHCPPPGRLFVLRARDGEDEAWLFLAIDKGQAAAFTCWYSLGFGAIYTGSEAQHLLTALARALRRYPGIALASLYPLHAGDPLVAAFRRAGWLVRVEPSSVSWRIATFGMNFATYWAGRPSKLRNTAERKSKAARLHIAIHRAFDAAAWADYEAVYRASWKPEEGSPAFLRALAEAEGAAGTLRLGVAYRQGTPLAAQLWLVEDGIATIHKLAYAESAKKLSPGTILSREMFRHVLDIDHVRAIDFGLGGDAYKADWMADSQPVLRLEAFNPRRPEGLYRFARGTASALVRGARSR